MTVIYALADLHTITVRQDPAKFRSNTWTPTPCCWPAASI